ncbi:uncharacterized protein JCM15063_004160 [Sporobolomyces koalae]|uniref:uncharacterized protein n=1 Tax=Sporobolomyces koalae TaxID=500713 RepID=UPI003179B606
MVSSDVTSKLHPSTLPLLVLLPIVCALPVEQPQPHLVHLFATALNQFYLPHEALAPDWTQWRRVIVSSEPGILEKCDIVCLEIEQTCKELLRGGPDAIIDWIHHDLRPLCSSHDDEDTSAIHHTPILRGSPLGVFLRKSALAFEKLGLEEFAQWCSLTRGWFGVNETKSTRHTPRRRPSPSGIKERPLSNPQQLLLSCLAYFHQANWKLLSVALEECFKISRSLNDRVTLQGCWSLVQRIPEQYRAGIATGSNHYQDDRSTGKKGKGRLVHPDDLLNPHDLLYQVCNDRSTSTSNNPHDVTRLLSKLLIAQSLAIASTTSNHKLSTPSTPATSNPNRSEIQYQNQVGGSERKYDVDPIEFDQELKFARARVWERAKLEPLANMYDDLVLEGPSLSKHDDLDLRTLLDRARKLSDSNQVEQALLLLFDSVETNEKRTRLGLARSTQDEPSDAEVGRRQREARFERWKQEVLACFDRDRFERDDLCNLDLNQAVPTALSDSLDGTTRDLDSPESIIDLAMHRLDMTGCQSRIEAERGVHELEAIKNQILIFGRSTCDHVGGTDSEEESMDELDQEDLRILDGEMNRRDLSRVEAKYWFSLARLEIVAHDYDGKFSVS